ncbi:MAG: TetR/AcrR family transcriptional regulator [Oscillospiraceae bacterium]|nr:TetR/AcrR family transcriptional regulator [Oscillospiraceae bacterium]
MAENSSKLRDIITAAAMQCFRARDYDSISVGDICQAAGVARSSFYRVFSGKKDVIRYIFEHTDTNSIVSIEALLAAENDFDRMWIIGDRYISLSKELGYEFTAAIMMLCVRGDLDLLGLGHSVDAWFIRLTRNCQKTGVILSREPPELLGPMFVDMVYHLLYEWCCRKGEFPIRAEARRRTEILANVAPEYRWTAKQLAEADK